MYPAVFSKIFQSEPLPSLGKKLKSWGIRGVQFNYINIGIDDIPADLKPDILTKARKTFSDNGICIEAVSGTVNLIDPDEKKRELGLTQLERIIRNAGHLGTPFVSICTGSMHPESRWKYHPGNCSREAWNSLRRSVDRVLPAAEESGVTLCLEPELTNVVSSAVKARRFLDEVGSSRLKIVMDGANLFEKGTLSDMERILKNAIELLGPDIVLAHAKDLNHDGDAGNLAAGTGLLNYDIYLQQLYSAGYRGALILHSLDPEQVEGSVGFLKAVLNRMGIENGQNP